MIRKIKEKSEQVPVPKALEPRQIEAKACRKEEKSVDSGENRCWAKKDAWC
ncbi:MAG: hypothetical protein ACLU80_00675 [Dorea sp.]